jgi:hypothetical protein
MFLRVVERLVIVCGLGWGITIQGCGDDDQSPTQEDGGLDGGAKDGGMAEAGPARDSGPPVVRCGENTCTSAPLITTTIHACCVLDDEGEETDVCGLVAEDIKRVNTSSPFTGCIPKDVPYASLSEYCGSFFDLTEPEGDHTNGGLDVESPTGLFVFEGCCLPTGECGANITSPRGISADIIDSHLGCVSYKRLQTAFGGDAPAPETLEILPFCNPDTGEPVSSGTVPNVPEFVCGCGDGVVFDGEGIPCLSNLPEQVCGANPATDEELALVPEFICGCSADSKLPCLRNLPVGTCGTKEIDADSEELALVPQFICGALGGEPTRLPTLPNVESDVCGKKAMSADSEELEEVPEFICGAQGNPEAWLPLLRNVDAAVCGRKPITGASAELAEVPQFICGAEDSAETPLPLLRNVPSTVCGKKVMTANSQELLAVPEFICGGIGGPFTLLPTMRNVDAAICGGKPMLAGSEELARVPEFVCGCDGETVPQTVCMRHVEATLCGTEETQVDGKGTPDAGDDCLVGVPEYTFGCGPDGAPSAASAASAVCLRHAETLFGCVDTAVDTKTTPSIDDDCLRGAPEYLRGCGEGLLTDAAWPGCLPYAAALFGCAEIVVAPRTVAEHICGCGDALTDLAQPAPAYPCLSRVATTICGAIGVTASTQASGVSNDVCGCGDAVSSGSDCVKNVPTTICGAIPVCTIDSCPDGETCADSNADGIGDACQP